jgi:3-polyprenyl-4-hydroxybenzoate decarboxylase
MNTAATKKFPGEGFKRAWPPLIKMDEAVKAKIARLVDSFKANASYLRQSWDIS